MRRKRRSLLRFRYRMSITRSITVRLSPEDHQWVERLAARNGISVSAEVRAMLHALRLAVASDKLQELDLGILELSSR
jgi:uncharacterized protein involved in type VI secretion and phage assembly